MGNGLVAEDEKAMRDRETRWAVVEKLQARSKEGPKQVGAGRLKNRLVGCYTWHVPGDWLGRMVWGVSDDLI